MAFLHNADTWLVLAGGTVAAGWHAGGDRRCRGAGAGRRGLARRGPPIRSPAAGRSAAAVSGPPALELRDVSFTYGGRRQRLAWAPARPEAAADPVLDGLSLTVAAGEILAVQVPTAPESPRCCGTSTACSSPRQAASWSTGGTSAGSPRGVWPARSGSSSSSPGTSCLSGPWSGKSASAGPAPAPHGGRGRPRNTMGGSGPGGAAGPRRRRPGAPCRAAPGGTAGVPAAPAGAGHSPGPASLCPCPGRADRCPGRPWAGRLDRVVRSTTAEGTAVVLVTHDLDYARSIAHRLVRLDSGRLRAPADSASG